MIEVIKCKLQKFLGRWFALLLFLRCFPWCITSKFHISTKCGISSGGNCSVCLFRQQHMWQIHFDGSYSRIRTEQLKPGGDREKKPALHQILNLHALSRSPAETVACSQVRSFLFLWFFSAVVPVWMTLIYYLCLLNDVAEVYDTFKL